MKWKVCPERTDLIHVNYRKLCSILVDVEEWGQVVIIGMLTRYARTQFVDPNGANAMVMSEKEKPFYEDNSDQEEMASKKEEPASIDPDLRLLLRNTKPLLQSRNASVNWFLCFRKKKHLVWIHHF